MRRSRRLVISSFATVGNYDYGFYWYLYQDGTIELEVKLTGIISTGARARRASAPRTARSSPRASNAPVHQHFFNVRLDIDVDGRANTVDEVDVVAAAAGPENPYGNAFGPRATPLATRGARPPRASTAAVGALVEDRQPERPQPRSASRSATSSSRARTPAPFAAARRVGAQRAGLHRASTSG